MKAKEYIDRCNEKLTIIEPLINKKHNEFVTEIIEQMTSNINKLTKALLTIEHMNITNKKEIKVI